MTSLQWGTPERRPPPLSPKGEKQERNRRIRGNPGMNSSQTTPPRGQGRESDASVALVSTAITPDSPPSRPPLKPATCAPPPCPSGTSPEGLFHSPNHPIT